MPRNKAQVWPNMHPFASLEQFPIVDDRGVERAQFAISALLEGNRKVATAGQAADVAIETWNLLLSAPNARTLLADIPAADMVDLRDWMVESIAREAGLPLTEVVAALDVHVWRGVQGH